MSLRPINDPHDDEWWAGYWRAIAGGLSAIGIILVVYWFLAGVS